MNFGIIQLENRQWKVLCLFVIGAIAIAYLSFFHVRTPDILVKFMRPELVGSYKENVTSKVRVTSRKTENNSLPVDIVNATQITYFNTSSKRINVRVSFSGFKSIITTQAFMRGAYVDPLHIPTDTLEFFTIRLNLHFEPEFRSRGFKKFQQNSCL